MRKTCKDENVIGAPDGDAAIPGFYSPALPILDCGEGGTVHCLISYTILKTILKKEIKMKMKQDLVNNLNSVLITMNLPLKPFS